MPAHVDGTVGPRPNFYSLCDPALMFINLRTCRLGVHPVCDGARFLHSGSMLMALGAGRGPRLPSFSFSHGNQAEKSPHFVKTGPVPRQKASL